MSRDKYGPLAEQIANYYGIPNDLFQSVIDHETGGKWDPNVKGTSGEIGLGQLMPDTARGLGLTVSDQQDDRSNPGRNLDGAARYLLQGYQATGSWKGALSYYNTGRTELTPAGEKYQKNVLGSWERLYGSPPEDYEPGVVPPTPPPFTLPEQLQFQTPGQELSDFGYQPGAPQQPRFDLAMPVTGEIAGGFSDARERTNKAGKKYSEPHRSGDILAAAGSPVVAPDDMIFEAGGKGGTNLKDGDGWAWFRNPKTGREYRFAHIGDVDLKPGQVIRKGEQFSTVGSVIKDPHLHFQVRENGEPVDWMGKMGLARGSRVNEYTAAQQYPGHEFDPQGLTQLWRGVKQGADKATAFAGALMGAMQPEEKAILMAHGMDPDRVEAIDQAGQMYSTDAFRGALKNFTFNIYQPPEKEPRTGWLTDPNRRLTIPPQQDELRQFAEGYGELVGLAGPAGFIHAGIRKGLRETGHLGNILLNQWMGRTLVSGATGGIFGAGSAAGRDFAQGKLNYDTAYKMIGEGGMDALAFMAFHLGMEGAIAAVGLGAPFAKKLAGSFREAMGKRVSPDFNKPYADMTDDEIFTAFQNMYKSGRTDELKNLAKKNKAFRDAMIRYNRVAAEKAGMTPSAAYPGEGTTPAAEQPMTPYRPEMARGKPQAEPRTAPTEPYTQPISEPEPQKPAEPWVKGSFVKETAMGPMTMKGMTRGDLAVFTARQLSGEDGYMVAHMGTGEILSGPFAMSKKAAYKFADEWKPEQGPAPTSEEKGARPAPSEMGRPTTYRTGPPPGAQLPPQYGKMPFYVESPTRAPEPQAEARPEKPSETDKAGKYHVEDAPYNGFWVKDAEGKIKGYVGPSTRISDGQVISWTVAEHDGKSIGQGIKHFPVDDKQGAIDWALNYQWDKEPHEMTSTQYMRMKAREKTGQPFPLDAADEDFHRQAVKQAYKAGKELPEEVKREYEHLIKQWDKKKKKAAPAPTAPVQGDLGDLWNGWHWGAEPVATIPNEPFAWYGSEDPEQALAGIADNEDGKFYIKRRDGSFIYNPETGDALFDDVESALKAAQPIKMGGEGEQEGIEVIGPAEEGETEVTAAPGAPGTEAPAETLPDEEKGTFLDDVADKQDEQIYGWHGFTKDEFLGSWVMDQAHELDELVGEDIWGNMKIEARVQEGPDGFICTRAKDNALIPNPETGDIWFPTPDLAKLAYHRREVLEAIREGLDIPDKVRAQFPELRQMSLPEPQLVSDEHLDELTGNTYVKDVKKEGERHGPATSATSGQGADTSPGVEGPGTEDLQGAKGEGPTLAVPGGPGTADDGRLGPGESERGGTVEAGQPGPSEAGPGVEVSGETPPANRENTRRDTGHVHRVSGPDYRADLGSLKREGGWHSTAARNLDIIQLIRALEKEGRQATPDEQALIARFTGWGSSEIANNLFPGYRSGEKVRPDLASEKWKPLVQRVLDLMTQEEIASAATATQYSHYTDERIIRSMYRALEHLGFTGGKILEPGAGTGLFAVALPEHIYQGSKYTGIERDHIPAQILKQLLPRQIILEADYIKQQLPDNYFDVAVGNPPFARTKIIADPTYAKYAFPLHDYFFAKTMDKLRPGGILAFITSRFTMDKKGNRIRKWLDERADFLGAIRLPKTAHEQHAGTEVVTDIIFLRKRKPGAPNVSLPWLESKELPSGTSWIPGTMVNEYFFNHPEMVLGKQSFTGSMRRANEYTVEPTGDLEEGLTKAIAQLPAKAYSITGKLPEEQKELVQEKEFNPKHTKEGGVYINDKDELMIVNQGVGVPLQGFRVVNSKGELSPLKLSDKDIAWMKDYVGLRNLIKQAQYDQLTEGPWEDSWEALKKGYKSFVKKHGFINKFKLSERTKTDPDTGEEITYDTRRYLNERLYFNDVEWPLVTALESINDGGEIVPGNMLRHRVIYKPTPKQPSTPFEALALTLDDLGRLDLDHISNLVDMPKEEVIDALGDLIYENPSTNQHELADNYLSGYVVQKLADAVIAAQHDPRFQRNVEALEKVQPVPLSPKDIQVNLGAAWVNPKYIKDFAQEVLERNVAVSYDPRINNWKLDYYRNYRSSEWGTQDKDPEQILDSILNSRSMKITRTEREPGGGTKTYTDQEATTQVNELAKRMKERFSAWVWEDADRTREITEFYNRQYNNIAPRRFDGSHLTLPGFSAHMELYDHQKRVIWRMIQDGNTYLAHAVGAGKTLEMICGGMEMKRLGLISKPMYVVPNHMLGQFSREFVEAYPLANVMVADEKNFHTKVRKRFMAQAALNDPDAIIVTHSSFGLLNLQPDSVAEIKRKYITELEDVIDDMKRDKEDKRLIKRIEQRKEALEQKFDSLVSRARDRALTFEEMGVDFLFVDEAHEFRKLDFITNRQAKGIDSTGSKKAMDLYIKTLHLEKKNPGRSHAFASGTPITNTMGELYTIMKFFDEEGMERDAMSHFDSWASMFGQIWSDLEMNAAGRYQPVERFSRFVNVPELMKRVRMFMDVLTFSQLGNKVILPDVEGGQAELVITPSSSRLKTYQDEVLQPRLQLAKGAPPGYDDPVINIITDGRLASIDLRFVGFPDDPNSKLERYIEGIAQDYKNHMDAVYTDPQTGDAYPVKGSTHICFYNHGFGKMVAERRGFNARQHVMTRLAELGVNTREVAWIDDYKTASAREGLFKQMREGKMKILFGSAKRMGTGVNVQPRLRTLHYLDPPWYPADVEQPEGRIKRQGNLNAVQGDKMISLKRYATKGSYDSTMWQMVGRKARFIEQAFLGDDSIRTMDDISEVSQYQMAAALSSGDERLIQLVGLNSEVEKLERLQTAHWREQVALESKARQGEVYANSLRKRIAAYDKAIEKTGGPGAFIREIEGKVEGSAKVYDNREDFGEVIKSRFNATVLDIGSIKKKAGPKKIGALNGNDIMVYTTPTSKEPFFSGWLRLEISPGVSEDIEAGVLALGESTSAQGLVTRMVNVVNGLTKEKARSEQNLADTEDELKSVKKRLGTPFPQEAELNEKIAEAARLEAELRAEGQDPPNQETSGALAGSGDMRPVVRRTGPTIQTALRERIPMPGEGAELNPKLNQDDRMRAHKLYAGVPGPDTMELLRKLREMGEEYLQDMTDDDMALLTKAFDLPFWQAKSDPQGGPEFEIQRTRETLRHWLNQELMDELTPTIQWANDVKGKPMWENFKKAVWHYDLKRKEPTDQQLKRFRLDDEAISHYRKLREMLDYIWDEDIVNLMAEHMGIPRNEIEDMRRERGKIEGFFPHLREGKYFVRATNPSTGETEYFELFDDLLATLSGKSIKAKAKVKKLAQDVPWADISTGKMKKLPEEVFWRVDANSMQAIIDAAVKDITGSDDAEIELRDALLRAVAKQLQSRGFGSHFLQRKDIPGFDKSDPIKAVIRFITGYNGFKTKLVSAIEFRRALRNRDLATKRGQYWQKYARDMLANSEPLDKTVDKARGAFFFWFLGFVPRQMVLQPTQNFVAGVPVLEKFSKWSSAKITAEMNRSAKDVAEDVINRLRGRGKIAKLRRLSADEITGLDMARRKGIISDQLAQEYEGYLRSTIGNAGVRLGKILSFFIGNAEIFNRETMYITAYRIATRELGLGHLDAMKFAEDRVDEAHFVYGKGNLPGWARGGDMAKLARAGYTFRSFNYNLGRLYIHLGGEKRYRALLKSWLALLAFGGLSALWGYKELEAFVQRRTGTNFRSWLMQKSEYWGKLAAYGLPAFVGVDLSGSLGIEAMKFEGKDFPSKVGNFALDLLGVPGELVRIPYRTLESISRGDYRRAVEDAMPSFMKAPLAAWRLHDEGMTTRRGKEITGPQGPVKLTPWQTFLKAMTFRTIPEADARRQYEAQQNALEGYTDQRQQILDRYRIAAGRYGHGSRQAKDIIKDAIAFNQTLARNKAFFIPPITNDSLKGKGETKRQHYLKKLYP